MAAMQTGARRATSATGAKTGKGKNGEVIVEKVMTSDSFLNREIKKAPLIEHDGSLVADISHIPNDLKITIQGAREQQSSRTSTWRFRAIAWSCSQACPVRANLARV